MLDLFDMSAVLNPVHRVATPVPVQLVGRWSVQEAEIVRKYMPEVESGPSVRAGYANLVRNADTQVPSGRVWHKNGTYVMSLPSFNADFSRKAYESFAWCAQAAANIFGCKLREPDMGLTLDDCLALPEDERVLSFDLETTSLLPTEGHFSCASFCLMDGSRCFVPAGHEEVRDAIGRLHAAGFSFLVCNAPYESKWVKHHCGFVMRLFDDVQVQAALLNEEGHKGLEYLSAWVGMAGYDYLMSEHLAPLSPKNGAVAGRRAHHEAPIQLLREYNALDTIATALIHRCMKHKLAEEFAEAGVRNCLSYRCLLDSQTTLASMELNGMYVDPVEMLRSRAYLDQVSEGAIRVIAEECAKRGNQPDLTNLGNPKDRMKALHAAGVKCKSAAKKELIRYKKSEVVDAMLAWSSAQSLKAGVMKYAEDACARGGLLKTNFSVTALVTGQLTSRNPPMLNIAKSPIRKMFRSRFGDDGVLLSLDYSQLHLRIMANVAKCRGFIDAFLEDRDLHSLTGALVVMGMDEDKFLERLADGDNECAEARQTGKRINFSVITEVTGHGLSELLGSSVRQADIVLSRFYDVYPEVLAAHERQHELAAKQGYVVSPTGRLRHLREARSRVPKLRARAGRQATDYLVSNPGRTCTLIAMNAMHERLTDGGMRSVIINQLHDAIIHDVHLSELDTVLEWVRPCYIDEPHAAMPEVFDPVKLALDGHYGPHWHHKEDSTPVVVA